jgi:uncharacterized protein
VTKYKCRMNGFVSEISRVVAAIVLLLWPLGTYAIAGAVKDAGHSSLDFIPGAQFTFDGVLGQRVKANVEKWLLETPGKNPGLLDMFADREMNKGGGDANDSHQLVPWAGEYVGKYLISAVQAMRMSDNPRLHKTVGNVVDRVVQLQAEDGYLGPFPKKDRLIGQWDLWGNYHVMLGLVMWHEQTGDARALIAARKAADLVCKTFLDTKRRVLDAGSCDQNMSIIHALAILYRKTGEPRYLRMAKEVLKDFEKAGDYYREGLKGTDFFNTPLPRWESLHSVQGLAELYLLTGDDTFRRSFLHHWASIRRFDLRNTGGFSSHEQATGNPFLNDAIETCCVIAWQAIMIDALRLSGDATIADDLELATFNAVAGAQHPSGEWWTYDAAMNHGKRLPFHVQHAWQSRPNAPVLGCCPTNAPRGLGMLSEWAVMRNAKGLTLNYYGPMRANVTLVDGTPMVVEEKTDYPIGDTIRIKIVPPATKLFTLAMRIPVWSAIMEVLVNGQAAAGVKSGGYLRLTRPWQPGDVIVLRLDLSIRYESGDLEQADNVSLYRGPLLLCVDERFTSAASIKVDVNKLDRVRLVPIDETIAKMAGPFRPWVVLDLLIDKGKPLRLIDFANAGGATGRDYQSWLPAVGMRPPRPVAWEPSDGTTIGPGAIQFRWREQAVPELKDRRYTVMISDSPGFERTILQQDSRDGVTAMVPVDDIRKFQLQKHYYWKVVARDRFGQAESVPPYKRFTLDATATPMVILSPRSDRMITAVPLRGDVNPDFGRLIEARGWKPAPGPNGEPNQAVELDGRNGRLKYALSAFPKREYTVAVWVSVTKLPTTPNGQVFSAWCGPDEPLRIVVMNGKMFGRIFSGNWATTDGVPVELNRWHHIAAVKAREKFTLYVDSQPRSSAFVPAILVSNAKDFALGGNPNYQGEPEFLAARLADLRFYDRALSVEELKRVCQAIRPK